MTLRVHEINSALYRVQNNKSLREASRGDYDKLWKTAGDALYDIAHEAHSDGADKEAKFLELLAEVMESLSQGHDKVRDAQKAFKIASGYLDEIASTID